MASQPARTLDVSAFLQQLTFTRFHLHILLLSCLVTFFDGLDFALVSVTLPEIRDDMALTEAQMGDVSTAAFMGQMIGSLIGSYIADIVGRRPVIIISTLAAAVLTFVTGFAGSPEVLFVLRLLGGLAIGGLLAPIWSLNIESMPKSMRATSVTIIMLGFSIGSAGAAQAANLLASPEGWYAGLYAAGAVPSFMAEPSWQMVFFFCGGLTALLAAILFTFLPESARWMVASGKPAGRIVPMLSRFDPTFDASEYSAFALSDERKTNDKQDPFSKMKELFKGWLAYITPLIWAAYFFSSFSIYLKTAFGVVFLEELGLTVDTARDISSVGGISGAIAGVLLLMLTERRGPGGIILAPLIAIPFVLLLGFGIVLDGPAFIPVVLVGMVMVGAGHAAVISITSIYYPSAVRATGGGWASFMAKFAAVAAPLIGARLFLGSKQAVLDGYVATAVCLAGIVVCILALSHYAKKLKGTSAPGQAPVAVAQAAE
ncbi:MFS transporter [Aurantiacibacter flavus]|uniref:MFS transporter n=1 Tax=Aurantiacibacter flavus TaxID=3145232 RepID=A0ABV0D0N4_9SPHN